MLALHNDTYTNKKPQTIIRFHNWRIIIHHLGFSCYKQRKWSHQILHTPENNTVSICPHLLIPNPTFRNVISEVNTEVQEKLFYLIFVHFSMHYCDDYIEIGWSTSKWIIFWFGVLHPFQIVIENYSEFNNFSSLEIIKRWSSTYDPIWNSNKSSHNLGHLVNPQKTTGTWWFQYFFFMLFIETPQRKTL